MVRAHSSALRATRTYVKFTFDKSGLSEIVSEINGYSQWPSASHPVATSFPETRSRSTTSQNPFYRKSRETWYVEVDGRQINPGKDRVDAFQRYRAIMAAPPEVRPIHAMSTGEGLKLTELFNRFLD